MSNERFILTLEAGKHPTPAVIRLRQILKLCLRAFAFRAIDVREISEVPETAIAATESDE